jgi:hypothetical protein
MLPCSVTMTTETYSRRAKHATWLNYLEQAKGRATPFFVMIA